MLDQLLASLPDFLTLNIVTAALVGTIAAATAALISQVRQNRLEYERASAKRRLVAHVDDLQRQQQRYREALAQRSVVRGEAALGGGILLDDEFEQAALSRHSASTDQHAHAQFVSAVEGIVRAEGRRGFWWGFLQNFFFFGLGTGTTLLLPRFFP